MLAKFAIFLGVQKNELKCLMQTVHLNSFIGAAVRFYIAFEFLALSMGSWTGTTRVLIVHQLGRTVRNRPSGVALYRSSGVVCANRTTRARRSIILFSGCVVEWLQGRAPIV